MFLNQTQIATKLQPLWRICFEINCLWCFTTTASKLIIILKTLQELKISGIDVNSSVKRTCIYYFITAGIESTCFSRCHIHGLACCVNGDFILVGESLTQVLYCGFMTGPAALLNAQNLAYFCIWQCKSSCCKSDQRCS